MTRLYDVLTATLYPVRARVGDRIVACRGHERPIVVVRRVAHNWEPIEIGPPNFEALEAWEVDGVIKLRAIDPSR